MRTIRLNGRIIELQPRWSEKVIEFREKFEWENAVAQWLEENCPVQESRAVSVLCDLVPWHVPHRTNKNRIQLVRQCIKTLCINGTLQRVDGELRMGKEPICNAVVVTASCKSCGTDFVVARSDARYCSSGCRQKSYRRRCKAA
jgi:hypothetical protein